MSLIFKSTMKKADLVTPTFNVMSIIDVMTGNYLQGANGEYILNGGLMPLNGAVGEGNTFKSTFLYCLNFIAWSRYSSSMLGVYDTENNLQFARLNNLASQQTGEEIILEVDERFNLTKSSDVPGEKWWEDKKSLTEIKLATKEAYLTSPFINVGTKEKIKMIVPTFELLDSISGWQPSAILERFDEHEVGDNKNNTLYAKENLYKTQLLQDMMMTASRANIYISTLGHISNKLSLDGKPVSKDMLFLPQGKKLGGVPKKFEYYTNICWFITKTQLLQNKDKEAQYPSEGDRNSGDTDLTEVIMTPIRNKQGHSGIVIKLVFSQAEGLLVGLSEFHWCKECKYGITQSGIGYVVDLYPNEKLLRTTVRSKIKEDKKLKRALEITAEMCTLNITQKANPLWQKYKCTPQELYEGIKEKGYDWDVLLNTRGYWLFDEDITKDTLPYLSTMDLLRMRAGDYKPHWLK